MAVAIHPIHRKLAEISYMCTNSNGALKIDVTTLRLLEPLLKQNLQMIRRLDELKNLSQIAYEQNDYEWVQNICKDIERLEQDLFLV